MKKLYWEKKGKIFHPELIDSNYSHGQVPYAIILDNRVRVFFTSRPPKRENGYVSYIFFLDLDINNLSKILYIHKKPLLDLGKVGSFDEFGTMPCSIIWNEEAKQYYMYYVGWTRGISVPYYTSNGLAISSDSCNTFEKYSEGPIMPRNHIDPYITGCPRVIKNGNKWYNFYLSGTGWQEYNNRMESIYNINLSTSENGVDWHILKKDLIPKRYNEECQTCVTVFSLNNLYHMYFTYRQAIDFRNSQRGYRIGYAFSSDLVNWKRKDDLGGVVLSETGWDSEMISYPQVIKINNEFVIFYCGNNFGEGGFGYATLSKS